MSPLAEGIDVFELPGREMRRTIVFGNHKASWASRHEARQSYGLELASLEVICPCWRHRHPAGGAYSAQAEVFGELLPKRLGAFISKKYIQCSYKKHTGRRAGEKHEAVMKTITARRRAMNLPMIIDDERRKMSKLGEAKGGALS